MAHRKTHAGGPARGRGAGGGPRARIAAGMKTGVGVGVGVGVIGLVVGAFALAARDDTPPGIRRTAALAPETPGHARRPGPADALPAPRPASPTPRPVPGGQASPTPITPEAVAALVGPLRAEAMGDRWQALSELIPDEILDEIRDLHERLRDDPADAAALAALAEALEPYQAVIDAWVEASRVEDPDFGIDWSQGLDTLLPHLGPARRGTRLLAAAATVAAATGQADEAARLAAASLRLSGQILEEPVLLSSLVSVAMIADAEFAVSAALAAPGDGARAELAAAIERFAGNDPFAVLDALRWESGMVRRTFLEQRDRLATPSGAGAFLERYGAAPDPRFAAALHLAGNFDENLERELGGYERFLQEAALAVTTPGPPERLAELRRRLEAGEFGVLAGAIAPPLDNLRDTHAVGEAALRRMRAALGGLTPPAEASAAHP